MAQTSNKQRFRRARLITAATPDTSPNAQALVAASAAVVNLAEAFGSPSQRETRGFRLKYTHPSADQRLSIVPWHWDAAGERWAFSAGIADVKPDELLEDLEIGPGDVYFQITAYAVGVTVDANNPVELLITEA